MIPSTSDSFWESDEAVDRFTDREPDLRLQELLQGYAEPGAVRVLDVGCAAGRNTLLLAGRGFDVHAVDSSAAMVARTRQRLVPLLGSEEAERRVQRGAMENLGRFADASVDLVVAIGVLHQAQSERQWTAAIREMTRCLVHRGLLLAAVWSPRSRPHGECVRLAEGEENVYEGFHSGTHYLVEAPGLDSAMAAAGLRPAAPTEEVWVENERGFRVTINGLYRRVHR